MSVLTCALILVYFISEIFTKNKFYKISMVASEENPGHPALFLHGESPVWDPDRQSLFFVDALEQNIHRLDYNTGKIDTKHIAYGQVNVVSTIAGSSRLLVAVRSALYVLDWNGAGDAALRLLTTVDHGLPDNVINEGKPDVLGRFWAGTKGPQAGDDVTPDKATLYSVDQDSLLQCTKGPQAGDDVTPDKATLYSVDQDSLLQPRVQLRPVSISNGLVWSLNNTVLYYIDSSTQKVEAFDYDFQKGEISGRRTIIDISGYGFEDAIPDGMTIDSQGYLWVAIMFGGAVLHVDPDTRQLIYSYKLPVSRVTSLSWGGPNLDELFLTTSRNGVDESSEPLAGAIFTIRDTGSRGVLPFSFKFDVADTY